MIRKGVMLETGRAVQGPSVELLTCGEGVSVSTEEYRRENITILLTGTEILRHES